MLTSRNVGKREIWCFIKPLHDIPFCSHTTKRRCEPNLSCLSEGIAKHP